MLGERQSSEATLVTAATAQDAGIGAKMLTALASKLDDIARGGDISQLAPDDALGSLDRTPPANDALAGRAGQPQPGEGSRRHEPEQGSTPRAFATAAYRAHAEAPGAGVYARRAALSQMLDRGVMVDGAAQPTAQVLAARVQREQRDIRVEHGEVGALLGQAIVQHPRQRPVASTSVFFAGRPHHGERRVRFAFFCSASACTARSRGS